MDETQQVDDSLFDEAVQEVLKEYRLMRSRLRLIAEALQSEEWKDVYKGLPKSVDVSNAAKNAENLIKLIRDHEASLGKTCNSAGAGNGELFLRLDDAKSEVFGRLTRIRERRND